MSHSSQGRTSCAGCYKFSTWVYSITYNFCIDYIRKRKKDKSQSYEDLGRLGEIEDDVDDKEILEVRLDRLKDIMEVLPTEDKSILMMKYMDSMSIKEIGSVVNKSESAVKMQIKRAKMKFVKLHKAKFASQLHPY